VGRDRDGRPLEDPLAVHCFCMCNGSALLGDLLGISRSIERDLLSVLSIYPRIFLRVFISYHLLVGFLFLCCCVLLYFHVCVNCFGLVVSTCQVIGKKDLSDDTFMW